MSEFKKYFSIVTYAIVLFIGLSNLDIVINVLNQLVSVLMPLILGIAIAFVLNLLMNLIENKILSNFKKNKLIQNKKRAISMLITYILSFLFITLIIIFIVPQVIQSSKMLIDKLPEYADNIAKLGTDLYNKLGLTESILKDLFSNFKSVFSGLTEFTANTVMTLFSFTMGITSGALNLLMGIIFSAYILAQKEKLIEIISKINRAFNKKGVATYLSELAWNTNHIFSKFVGGQLTEAIILGSLCFIGLILLKVPYAPLVSVLIAITSLIPVVGAFIGTVPSVLIIAMESPTQALIFVIFIVILQQLEGNIIYPKVVGDAIGISGFWVFLAIIVGGGLFGIVGMLLGVPMMAVLYSVVKKAVDSRL